jgi:hypothetical protein
LDIALLTEEGFMTFERNTNSNEIIPLETRIEIDESDERMIKFG